MYSTSRPNWSAVSPSSIAWISGWISVTIFAVYALGLLVVLLVAENSPTTSTGGPCSLAR